MKKLLKGLLALFTINLLAIIAVTIFNSCQDEKNENNVNEKANFLATLKSSNETIGSVLLIKNGDKDNAVLRHSIDNSSIQFISLEFPSEIDANRKIDILKNITSFHDIASTVNQYNATYQYLTPDSNIDDGFGVPIEEVINSLNPLILESKQYLYSKGFTESDINEMIEEHQGQEVDLIPFVIALTAVEKENDRTASTNISPFFINSAHASYEAQDFIRCAMYAIGADAIFCLMSSSLKTWSLPLMKRAFGTIAKRFLGPIGVAIAAVSFGLCIVDAI